MAYVQLTPQGALLGKDGLPFYPVGINYVASYICTNFWQDFRPEALHADLKKIAQMGLNAVRIPMFWGYMEPREREYSEDIFPKFDLFLSWCKELGIYLMPWFLVGVATRDYDVPFRNERPFFTGDMVTIARDHIQHFVSRYKSEEQILMWDLCDEPEYYNRHPGAEQWPFSRDALMNWVQTLYQGVKAVDPNHLVTLGFGHIASANFGYHVLDMAKCLDLMVVTCYPLGISPRGADCLRNNYFLPFYVAFNRPYGNAVMTCEAPGFSSIMFSEKRIGLYYRASLYGSLIEGSNGVLPWAFNDFDESIWHECPLENYMLEPRFGIVANDGRIKPSGMELMSFARTVKALGLCDYQRQSAKAAVIIPRDYYANIEEAFPRIYMAYVLLKSHGVQVDLVWQDKPLTQYKLVCVADSAGFVTSYWHSLREYVRNGGNLFWSFDRVSALSVYLNELFGVETQTPALWEQEGVAITRLETEAVTATVIKTFTDGVAQLTHNQFGQGQALFAAQPVLDHLLALSDEAYASHPVHKLMDWVVSTCELRAPVRVSSAHVEVGCLQKRQGETLYVLENHQPQAVVCHVEADAARNRLSWLKVNENGQMSRLPYHDGDICFDACETLFLCEMAT